MLLAPGAREGAAADADAAGADARCVGVDRADSEGGSIRSVGAGGSTMAEGLPVTDGDALDEGDGGAAEDDAAAASEGAPPTPAPMVSTAGSDTTATMVGSGTGGLGIDGVDGEGATGFPDADAAGGAREGGTSSKSLGSSVG